MTSDELVKKCPEIAARLLDTAVSFTAFSGEAQEVSVRPLFSVAGRFPLTAQELVSRFPLIAAEVLRALRTRGWAQF